MRRISNSCLTSNIAIRAQVFAGDSGGGLASVPAFAAVDAKILLSLVVWYYVVDTTLNFRMWSIKNYKLNSIKSEYMNDPRFLITTGDRHFLLTLS